MNLVDSMRLLPGMFEHVGTDNYRTFFEVCNRCLKSDGVLLLHTIGKCSHISATGSVSPIHTNQSVYFDEQEFHTVPCP